MDFRAEIREALRDMVRDMQPEIALQCTVVSVDKQAGTCVVTGLKEEVDYYNVRLKAVVVDGNGRGVLAYPVVGSMVSIVLLDGIDTMAAVVQMSDIEELRLTVDNGVYLALTATGKLLLNGDGLGGVVKVEELVRRLNRLEQRMLSHQHLAAGQVTVVDPGTNTPLPLTQVVDLSNPTVQHG